MGAVLVLSSGAYMLTFSLLAFSLVYLTGLLIIGWVFGFKTFTYPEGD
ncbi:MAG: hypothetical protein ABIQ64_01175 [Candidatus Saccharimonadales bacterium]